MESPVKESKRMKHTWKVGDVAVIVRSKVTSSECFHYAMLGALAEVTFPTKHHRLITVVTETQFEPSAESIETYQNVTAEDLEYLGRLES